LAKEKPPIFGMLQRGGEVVIRMLENVKQVTIGPLIERTIAKGTLIYTDEYDIYSRLVEWGYGHETVCHASGEYARDDDGDGSCEVHVKGPSPGRRLSGIARGQFASGRVQSWG
jgi:transposase